MIWTDAQIMAQDLRSRLHFELTLKPDDLRTISSVNAASEVQPVTFLSFLNLWTIVPGRTTQRLKPQLHLVGPKSFQQQKNIFNVSLNLNKTKLKAYS